MFFVVVPLTAGVLTRRTLMRQIAGDVGRMAQRIEALSSRLKPTSILGLSPRGEHLEGDRDSKRVCGAGASCAEAGYRNVQVWPQKGHSASVPGSPHTLPSLHLRQPPRASCPFRCCW